VFQPKQWPEKQAGKTIENRTQPELVPNQASKSNIVEVPTSGNARYEGVFISSKASDLSVENRRAVPYCLLSHPIDQLLSGDAVGEACMIMGPGYQRSAAFTAINDQRI
jgi:hypothetical protein